MSKYTVNPPFRVTKCGECMFYQLELCFCKKKQEYRGAFSNICNWVHAQNIEMFEKWAREKEREEAQK